LLPEPGPLSGVKITGIETIALEDPGKYRFTLVRVRTDAGIDGIGQAESPSLVVDAAVRTRGGLESLIRGEDPLQVERLWQKMYAATGLWGRRGVTIAAIGAVETALWDIAGKMLGRPVSELIWRSAATVKDPAEILRRVRPYATVYSPGRTDEEIRARFGAAVERGFRAVKFEEVPGGFAHVDVRTDVRLIRLVRGIIGEERELMIDVQNVWRDAARAVQTARAIEPFRIYFLEAPLPADNLEAYRRLAEAIPIPIAAGDWGFTTRFEFQDLMERGGVDVVQPSTVRSGGIAEISKIAEAAFRRGLLCIPHCWNHLVGVAAAVHLAAVLPNMPYIEYPLAFPDSPLITDLLVPALRPDAEGWIEVPRRPGLGFVLDEALVKRYRVAAS
jgi:L-alanine-DL-glutamate epimerase-like enolase superfamily enzyme